LILNDKFDVILNPGFEDISSEGRNYCKDSYWLGAENNIGGIYGLTSVSFVSNIGAKLINGSNRVLLQYIDVVPNRTYQIFFYYNFSQVHQNTGEIDIAILDGEITNSFFYSDVKIESATFWEKNIQIESEHYKRGGISFSSGENTNVGIFVKSNIIETVYIDEFSINILY